MNPTEIAKGLHFFKETGFFEQEQAALQLLRDAYQLLFAADVTYSLIFGPLL